MNPPVVFISYSHDSAEHKEWVLDFATTLRKRGVDAVLDQWDLGPGGDLPHFMETQLERCDFVVMVCTKAYVDKANAGSGGVGYEKMIMTANLLSQIGDSKVIPIVRQSGLEAPTPTFMSSKIYIDFSRDEEEEYSLDELLRKLLGAPLYPKPEIGSASFEPMASSRPDRASDGVLRLMEAISSSFSNSSHDYLMLDELLHVSGMHRFTLDHYLETAAKDGLIVLSKEVNGTYIEITPKGRSYVFEHGLVGLS
ncbi:MAG: toll/interleukin-1 receptor domain-containing protein [Pseudomonadaceae bacterium]|nr:toll/interleukin-1 receptor domain-containing protein [Pseudomonadaceae bacterium]